MKVMITKAKTLVVAVVTMMAMTMTMMATAKGYNAIMKSQGSLWFSPFSWPCTRRKAAMYWRLIFDIFWHFADAIAISDIYELSDTSYCI
jgi:hypothetical protein